MSLDPRAASPIDPSDVDTRAVDFALALPAGESLSSCAVSIVSGECELAPTLQGAWASTAAATVTGTQAIVAIRNPVAPKVVLCFRGVSNAGRSLDQTRTLNVETR